MTEIKPFGIRDIHLEPCPFCGSEAKLISGKDFIAIYGFVECTHCHVKTKKFFEFVTDDASRKDVSKAQFKVWNHAAKAWNMRNTDHTADIGKKVSISCDHEKDHNADSSKMVCVDAISRQETIHAISDWIYDTTDERLPETVIRSLSAVQPERKRGEWILAEDGWYCSVCELYPPFDCDPEEKGIPYCPNCGADMRGGQDG